MKDLTFTDAIFIGYTKTTDGYDIVFSREGTEIQLPSIFKERTKIDDIWDKRTGLLEKYGSIQQDDKTQGCYFEIYKDQSLRRYSCIDIVSSYHNSAHNLIGWKNDRLPHGFLVSNGVIPDHIASYMTTNDTDKVLSLSIPKEMDLVCEAHGISPEQLFNDFVNVLTNDIFKNNSILPYSKVPWHELARAYLLASYGIKEGYRL